MWKLNFKPRTDAAPDKDAASVFFERMEPKILFSADAFSGLVSTDPFSDSNSANTGLNVSESAGLLNEAYAPAVNETDEPSVTAETASLQLDALQAALKGSDAENEAPTSLDSLEALLDGAGNQEERREIIFVDAATPDYQQLLGALNTESPGTDYQIFILQSERDGIVQITEILDGFEAVDAIHLVSHGNETGLQLGNNWLNQDSLSASSELLGTWSSVLEQDADILIYGCNLAAGESGLRLIDRLADLTGADVAASDDLTGAAELGGDWDLEYRVGDIESKVAVSEPMQQKWFAVLAPPVFQNGGPFNVDEGATATTVVGNVDADDGDGGAVDAGIFYTITTNVNPDGDGDDAFAIDSASGEITVNDAGDLDFEGASSLVITVEADDGSETSSTNVTIDLNDVAPKLSALGADVIKLGQAYTLDLTAVEPGTSGITSYTVNWGDGTITTEAYTGRTTEVSHIYTDAGFTYNITFAANDVSDTWTSSDLIVGNWIPGGEDVFIFDGETGSADGVFDSTGGAVDRPYAPVVGPDGNFYVSGYNSDNIAKFAADGSYLGLFSSHPQLNNPSGLAWGSDGNLYVANYGGDNILRFQADGIFIDEWGVGGTLNGPTGLAFGPDGDLYVSSWDNNLLVKIDGASGGAATTVIGAGLNRPEQIVFDGGGDLFIANGGNNEVARWDGAVLTSYFTHVDLSFATGLAFGPDGDLYVSSNSGDKILRYDGVTGTVFADDGPGGLMDPEYLTFTPDQQVTVVGNYAPTISVPSEVFINELHYDNLNVDTGEAIEVMGPAGTDLTGWSLALYSSGNGNIVYDTVALSGTIADQSNGYGTAVVNFPSNGIQNGVSDGIALINPKGQVIQFISYEGTLTAADGPAVGLTSVDIGVSETNATPVGYSLQLTGTGSEMTWMTESANTFGALNTGQNIFAFDNGFEDTDKVYTHAQMLALLGASDRDDADADLTVNITNVVNGTLVMSGGAGEFGTTFTFTPDPGFNGQLSFDYEVLDDDSAASAIGNGIIDIAPMSTADAVDDSYATDADTILAVAANGVLANDSSLIATPGATLEYIASQDTDGNNVWEDATGVVGYDFDFTGSDVVRDDNLSNAQAGISAAYVFGSGAPVTPNLGLSPDLFADLPGNPTDAAASFEFWIRPTDASGTEIIFDIGNGVDGSGNEGASLRLNGSTLEWLVWDDGGTSNAFATQDISAEIASGKFIQVVASFDPNDPANTVSLSINGGAASTGFNSNVNDWESSGESPAIGDNDGFTRTLNPTPGAELFRGEIAAFRFYESVLSTAEIQKNFDSMYFSVVAHDATSALGATVVVNGDGSFSYDPSTLFVTLPAGATTVDTFSYTMEDSGGSQDTAIVSVTVTGVNDAPTASNLSSTSAYNEGDASVPITDIVVSDVDAGETITATLTLADTATGSLSANDGATYTPGTGVWTISGSVAQVNTALANLAFNPTINNEVDTTIAVSIDDGDEDGSGALSGIIDLDVTPVNDAPTATNLSSTSAYNEGDASVPITDIVVSDVDTGETITATLTLADTATGSLSANDGATYTPGTGVWTITGTVANVNTALANLVFNPTVNNAVDTTIGVNIDDGDEDAGGPLTGTITLDVTPFNDAPTATNLSSTSTYNEGDASVPITNIVVSDVDAGDLITATLTLADTATGSLSANDGATYAVGTGVWTISGSVAQVNTALANLVFNPTVNNEVDTTIDVNIDDGDEDGSGALTGTITLDATPVNDPPTATGGISQSWLYNEGVAVLDLVDIVISDVDTGETITATLTLADTGTGSLSANDGATYDGLSGIWTITDTLANVNTALANLVFNPNTNNDINTTINVHIEDAAGAGPVDSTIDLDVTPFNDPPTATNLTQVLPYNEGDAVVAINDIVVTEVDTGDTITATLTLANTGTGTLSANDGATYDGLTGIWTITDTVANVNTALANVVFNPGLTNDVDTTITTHIEDALSTGPVDGSITLDVTPINDAPTATNLSSTSAYNEGDASVPITDIVVSDVDTGETITATLTLADTATGSLSANDGATYDGLTGIWTLTDTVANVNTALANLVFNPTVNNEVDTTIAVSIDDGDEDLSGALTGTIDLDVTPINDPPTATNLSSTSAYNEGDASVPITDIVVSDIDAGETITAILTLADPSTGGLSANDGATYTAATGIWAITGSVAQVNTALANLVFFPLVNNTLDTSIDVNIDDGDEDNSGPLSGTITLDVTPVNDPPTATNLSSTSAYNEGDASVPITDIVVSDIDGGDIITATLTLADTATGSLSANDGATYDGLTGIWTLTDTVANVNTALANLVFNPTLNNEVDTTIAVSIDDGDEDGSGALTGIIDLDVTPVNDAPTATNLSSTSNYDEGDASVALNDIVISDVDSGEAVTATLVLANVSTGSLSANDGATYNATTGVWTITGTVAQVNTALANLEFIPVATNTLDTTIAVSIDDGDEDSSGPLIGAMTITVDPLPVVEPPVVEPPVVEPPVDEDPPDEPEAEDPPEEPVDDVTALEVELVTSDPVLIPSRLTPAASLLPDPGVAPEAAKIRDYDNSNEDNKVRNAPLLKPAGVDTLITRLTQQLDLFDDPLQLIGAESFITRLNDMREELISETENTEKVIGSSLSVTAGLSVGYVVWLARSGVLLSSVLSSLPAWRFIDPLPVLAGMQAGGEGDDEESLESMVEEKEVDTKDPAELKGGNRNE